MKTHDSNHIEEISGSIRQLLAGDELAFCIKPSGHDRGSHVRMIDRGERRELIVPFLKAAVPNAYPFGVTEILGSAYQPDMPAHLDFRRRDILNVWHAVAGKARMYLAKLPDELHDSRRDLVGGFAALSPELQKNVEVIHATPGDTICFLGGVVTHAVVSTSPDRISAVGSFALRR